MKFDPKIPDVDLSTKAIFATRDPTEKDIDFGPTLWISAEYEPNRVFQGQKGKWLFVGKFYREKTE